MRVSARRKRCQGCDHLDTVTYRVTVEVHGKQVRATLCPTCLTGVENGDLPPLLARAS